MDIAIPVGCKNNPPRKIIPPNGKSVLSSFKRDETSPNFDELAGKSRITTIVKVRLERFAHEEDVRCG